MIITYVRMSDWGMILTRGNIARSHGCLRPQNSLAKCAWLWIYDDFIETSFLSFSLVFCWFYIKLDWRKISLSMLPRTGFQVLERVLIQILGFPLGEKLQLCTFSVFEHLSLFPILRAFVLLCSELQDSMNMPIKKGGRGIITTKICQKMLHGLWNSN